MGALAEWLASDKTRTLTNVWRRSGVSWDTVNRAKRGEKVGLAVAIKISEATGGQVPVSALTDEKEAVPVLAGDECDASGKPRPAA